MFVCLVAVCVACLWTGFINVRMRQEIRSLCLQLAELAQGSHMELTVLSRQKTLLTLCRAMNRVLAFRDRTHVQYEASQKQMQRNITSLAHDIRTPLTGACGYLQLAQECPEPEKQDHYLQCAGSRLKELEEMLEKMFLYTKLTSEEFTLSRKRLQVSPLLGDCLLGMYGAFQEKGVSPQVDFEMEGFTIQGDAEALRRVFLNLIQNALVHGTGGIAITQRGDCLIFENPVENTEGLNLDLIFERFYKGDTARRKGSSGLGLYIVRELTHRMGGDVHVELEAGNLRITLCFPAAKHNSHQ